MLAPMSVSGCCWIFGDGAAEEFFCEVVAAAEVEFFGEDAEGVFGDDEVDFCDAGVGGEGAEDLGGVDAAAGSGDGEGDVAGLSGFGHGMIIADCGVPPSPLLPARKPLVFIGIGEGFPAKIFQTNGLRPKYSKQRG